MSEINKEEAWMTWLFGLFFAAVVGLLLGAGVLYGKWMYGDWKCGMPGVHCRRIAK